MGKLSSRLCGLAVSRENFEFVKATAEVIDKLEERIEKLENPMLSLKPKESLEEVLERSHNEWIGLEDEGDFDTVCHEYQAMKIRQWMKENGYERN